MGAVAALATLAVASCDQWSGSGRERGASGWEPTSGGGRRPASTDREECPRPQSLYQRSGEFNDQEQQIRHLRRQAFRGDFFAQLELGSRYQALNETDNNIRDPIEAAVWYAMALANSDGFTPVNTQARRGLFDRLRPVSSFDDCRNYERWRAYGRLNGLLNRMSGDEREAVRDRVIYILSTQDAEGFRTLGRLHDAMYGPFGEPADNREGRDAFQGGRRNGRRHHALQAATSLFDRNDVDAYLFNYLAMETGDVSAYVLLRDFERSSASRSGYAAFVESKARRWTAPFEFYPPEAPPSGVPHSDESRARGDAADIALQRMGELPFVHVGRAFRYLGVTTGVPLGVGSMTRREVETFEAMLGHPMEGRLSYLERVRAIQFASERGSSEAQLVLAVMYSEGIGVPADYARAFYWYEEAARQGSPEASFALSTFFALGVAGVADQDKAEAVVHRLESALTGFRPSVTRLQAVLAQVSRSQR
ncbi:tetratricopeptide repeat protein [Brevundimonas sp.]|uniref:tetratricopeptide repeat protein n=1 Tax=Brevundimonas sp. TaxID=1871086 RepID=UPI0025E80DB4|nr:tetratricopeptide repeat protein [Brevundimonas sp.]